jgi:hypothetical protein
MSHASDCWEKSNLDIAGIASVRPTLVHPGTFLIQHSPVATGAPFATFAAMSGHTAETFAINQQEKEKVKLSP